MRERIAEFRDSGTGDLHSVTQPQPKARPLHHGGTEARRRTKNKWVLFEPLIPGCVQNPGPGYFSFLSPAEKLRTRKFWFCRRSPASDPNLRKKTRILGVVIRSRG